mgnify:CR=1 FL=1
MASWMLSKFGSNDLKKKYLNNITSMKNISSYCLTEPGSGSDANGMKTKGVPDKDNTSLKINGSKSFISGAGESDLYFVMMKTENKESDEMIVATLLHDIGDELAPMNHSQYAASILRPYVSEKTYWIILHHGLFQTYYSAHHLGGDRNARDKFKDHKYYQDTIDFCEKYDQCSFDPKYKSMSLEDFIPLIRKIFSKEPYYYL